MALGLKDLIQLAHIASTADKASPVSYSFGEEKFSYGDLQETLRTELAAIAGTPSLYRENKNTMFALMEQTIDDYLPKKVMQQYGDFAEIKQFAQGEKPIFVQKITQAAKRRAKQFITKVGLAGVYEVFKLDGRSFEVPATAYGGAAQIGIEEFLDGRVDWADVLDIVMEGLDEVIYIEIEKALKGAVDDLQATNKKTEAGFVEASMDNLLQIADSYGTGPSTIYCTYEFAATMVPATGDWVSDRMKDEKWNNGYLANYKGHRVIVMQQSFTDETNSKKVMDPSHAWIIPSGSNEKPVKISFEGQAIVREVENADWSRELQIYKKMGVGAMITNNICVYINSALTI